MKSQLKVSKEEWNEEFSSGRWDYLDANLTERARHAVIGMYCSGLSPNTAILDVGCGEGTLVDFLSPQQKQSYLGIDVSEEAIKRAKKKRGGNFRVAEVEKFSSELPFDIIVCNEMLYYVDYEAVVPHLLTQLAPEGHLIISLYQNEVNHLDTPIFDYLDEVLVRRESLQLSGEVSGEKVTWTIVCYTK